MTKQLRIGYICDFFFDDYQINLWNGIKETAQKLGMNAMCLPIGCFRHPLEKETKRDRLLDLINPSLFDAFIIAEGLIFTYSQYTEHSNRFKDILSIPVIGIGDSIPDIPHIKIDNTTAVKELCEHLIHEHQCKNIIFLGANEHDSDTCERVGSFTETMKKNSISNYTVLSCLPTPQSGEFALKEFVKMKKEKINAVVCVNDNMANTTILCLKSNGYKVPDDIIVSGFDDISFAPLMQPALTTIFQPVYQQGHRAILAIEKLYSGKLVSKLEIIHCELIIRESCGCNYNQHSSASTPPPFPESKSKVSKELEEQLKRQSLSAGSDEIVKSNIDAILKNLTKQIYSYIAKKNGKELNFAFSAAIHSLYKHLHTIIICKHLINDTVYSILETIKNESEQLRLLKSWSCFLTNLKNMDCQLIYKQIGEQIKISTDMHSIGQQLLSIKSMIELQDELDELFSSIHFYSNAIFLIDENGENGYLFHSGGEFTNLFKDTEITNCNSFFTHLFNAKNTQDHLLLLPLYSKSVFHGMLVLKDLNDGSILYENLILQLSDAINSVKQLETLQEHTLKIETSLLEKDILLKEIHHRVKNNLQVISSLINLKGNSITDPHFKSVINDIIGKVYSISLVHESLYQSKLFNSIAFSDYVSSLYLNLKQIHAPDIRIKLIIGSIDMELELEQAITCGLIFNEIFTNIFKHAFLPDNTQAQIEVKYHLEEEEGGKHIQQFTITDNGCGFKADDPKSMSGFGMILIRSLIEEQLNGHIKILSKKNMGTEVQFSFSFS